MLKAIIRGHYDIQKLRIQIGNRIVANFRAKLGIEASERAENAALKQISAEFDAIPAVKSSKKFKGTPIISKFAEYVLIRRYMELMSNEKQAVKNIIPVVVFIHLPDLSISSILCQIIGTQGVSVVKFLCLSASAAVGFKKYV